MQNTNGKDTLIYVEDLKQKEESSGDDNKDVEEVKQKNLKSKTLCIVVDTNIFIKSLSKLKDILAMKLQGEVYCCDAKILYKSISSFFSLFLSFLGDVKLILFIPWMVVTELDFMKDTSCSNEKLKKDVMSSIKFINSCLESKNERVVGKDQFFENSQISHSVFIFLAQTVFDVQNQKQLGTTPDDKIMSCCLQAQEKYETVVNIILINAN